LKPEWWGAPLFKRRCIRGKETCGDGGGCGGGDDENDDDDNNNNNNNKLIPWGRVPAKKCSAF